MHLFKSIHIKTFTLILPWLTGVGSGICPIETGAQSNGLARFA